MSEKCSRCKEDLEEWFEPCFGKYRGKALCRKCDEELRHHKVYRLRLKLSVHRMELKTLLGFLLYDLAKFFKRIKNGNR